MLATLAVLSLLLPSPVLHGGVFPAPPAAPVCPPPLPPPSPPPRPVGARSPAPSTASGPTSRGGGVGAPGAGLPFSLGPTGPNYLDWTRWWNFEREIYLGLRSIEFEGPVSGGKDRSSTRMALIPTRDTIDNRILPVLLQVLKSERDDGMISAALIAAARIGGGEHRDMSHRISLAIQEHLSTSSQEIAETAALSLGILGNDAALAPLLQILEGADGGRALVKKRVVPSRTRAFAAYGLGLMAHRRNDPQLRQRIAAALMEIIAVKHSIEDLPAAAMLAMGLCPVPNELCVPDRDTRASEHAYDVVSRAAQLRWLATRIEGSRRRGAAKNSVRMSPATLSHGMVAIGRLAKDAPPAARAEALTLLEQVATSRKIQNDQRTAAAVALGQGMTAGPRPEDRAGIRSLIEIVKSGQALERRFATIALAEATARRGPIMMIDDGSGSDAESTGWEELDLTQRILLRYLARGRADVMPWFAMALGIQRWHLEKAGVPWNSAVAIALREKVRSERSASYSGAYAMACALVHRGADEASLAKAGAQVHRAFQRTKDPIARGQMAIALGWLDYEPAREDLVDLMRTSRFQPELLWSASVALVLARDSNVVPLLIDTLKNARSVSSRGSAAAALGRVGDARATDPLVELLHDKGQPDAARAFAIVGLGLLCEDTPLPWRTPASHANPYFAVTGALSNGSSGLLDIN